MRTLQEKYNAIQEGNFSKDQFLVEARMQQPQLVTRFNGYDDAVQILKNRGMIQEAVVEEARLTKNNLADYRYKPTNEMDKYPYEQILRGLRVELEVMGIQGTPSAEEYAKALAKVSKNLAKDSIFYTNQLAGNNKKVDLHDKMVAVTAKNTVDTFNGMKKLKDLKESHTGNPNDKYVVRPCKNKKEPWAVWEGEERVKGFATKEEAKEYADKKNKKQGLSESVLREGIKNLIKKALMENEEDVYELYGEDSVEESAMGDLYQIAKEHDRFEHFVQAVEDEFGPVEDIAELEHIFNSTRGEDDIDYGDENFSDSEIDTEYESPSDRMFNSDAWVQAQRDMMETKKSLSELLK